MNLWELKREMENRLSSSDRSIRFDSRSEKLRVENKKNGKGVTISLTDLLNKYRDTGEEAIDTCVTAVKRGLRAMSTPYILKGHENRIFPVIRAASFPEKTSSGTELIVRKHTAETKILYALDLENSYKLIDRSLLKKEGLDEQVIVAMADFNLRALPVKMKKDVVRHNTFYFINYNDGYDASRILNHSLLTKMKEKAKGDLAVAVPHQDVLIFGDIVTPEGYDILAQMTMKFYSEGRIPITILPFIFEKGQLEPIFILAGRRSK